MPSCNTPKSKASVIAASHPKIYSRNRFCLGSECEVAVDRRQSRVNSALAHPRTPTPRCGDRTCNVARLATWLVRGALFVSQVQHQPHVLHGCSRGALAEIVEAGEENRLAVLLAGKDVEFEHV